MKNRWRLKPVKIRRATGVVATYYANPSKNTPVPSVAPRKPLFPSRGEAKGATATVTCPQCRATLSRSVPVAAVEDWVESHMRVHPKHYPNSRDN